MLAAVVCLTVLAVLALLLPFAVRNMASSRIDRAAASLNGSVTHGDISIAGVSTLLLPTMTFSNDSGLTVTADRIRIEVDPLAMVVGGRRITKVSVEQVAVKGGTADSPMDLADLAAKLTSGRGDDKAARPTAASSGRGRSARRTGSPLPDISVGRLSGSIHTSIFSGTVENGSASLGPDPDTMDAFARKLSFKFSLKPAGAATAYTINVSSDLESARRIRVASATISPSFKTSIRGVDVGIGGVEWRPGEITLISPTAAIPGSTWLPGGVRAAELRVKWSMAHEGDRPAISLIPDSLLKYVPKSLKLLAGTVTVSDIRIKRPVIEVMPPPPGATVTAAPGGTQLPPESVQKRTAGLFLTFAGSLESARERLTGLAAKYDGTRLGITGATVTYLSDRDRAARAAQSYSNLDIQVGKGQDGGVTARMRFECPESPSTLNEFDIAVLPDGDVKMNLKARNLKLAPYQVLFPRWLETDSRSALTDTDVKITLSRGPRLQLVGRFGIGQATVFVSEIASEPMRNVDLSMSGNILVDGPASTVTATDAVFSLGEIHVPFSFDGTLMNLAPRFVLSGRIDRLPGESLLTSIPREAIPVLAGARLSGTFAATIKLDVNTADLSRLNFDFAPDMADLVTIDLGPAVNLELLRSTFLHRIEDRDHVVTRTIGVGSPGWVPFEDVPSYFIRALTISEDARFFKHQGFSHAGIQRSLKVNLERGGFFQGASTLSQQLVKNLFLSREKTLSRKLQEAFITWQVERNLSKEKILELYLNIIEWGPDVWGLKEAANHYFATDPSQLSVLEAAFLVLIIPNPAKYHEFLEQRRVPPWFMTKVRKLVETLRSVGAISDLQALGTLQQTVRFPVDQTPENAVPDSEFND